MTYLLIAVLAYAAMVLVIHFLVDPHLPPSACHENCDQGRMCTCRSRS